MCKKIFALYVLLLAVFLLAACGAKDTPPDSSLPEPNPHDGVFTSEYGTMTFHGDGESITFDFTLELQEATGLPGGEQNGTYVYFCSSTDSGATTRRSASGSLLRTHLTILSMTLP